MLATPELIALAGLSDQAVLALDRGDLVLVAETWASDIAWFAIVDLFDDFDGPIQDLARQIGYFESESPLSNVHVGALISPDTVAALELPTRDGGTIVLKTASFSTEDVRVLEDGGMTHFETTTIPYSDNGSTIIQFVTLGIALVLTLIVYRVIATLIAAETDEDVATMISIGAPRRARQSLLAWQTAVHLSVALAVAIPAGFLLGTVLLAAQNSGNRGFLTTGPGGSVDGSAALLAVPWITVLGLLALPVLGYAFVSLTSRSKAPTLSRRLN